MHVLSYHVLVQLRIERCKNFELDAKLAEFPTLWNKG
jgi:hypothetical protein